MKKESIEKSKFLLVDVQLLPNVFSKVVEVDMISKRHKNRSINSIVDEVGISRSAYYKYKDHVFPFYETSHGKTLTLLLVVDDTTGLLSAIIAQVANAKANILTINQNMPINGLADVSMTIETDKMSDTLEQLMGRLTEVNGVRKCEIIARD